MEVHFVENRENEFLYGDGYYTGEMNEINEKHGYGVWKSEDNIE